ncbi:MAG: glycosyltransferase family 4 protein [Candidatus Dormibacteria bacterium]
MPVAAPLDPGTERAPEPGVLFVTTRSWPSEGGIEGYLRRVAREFAVERPVRVAALLPDGRPLTRALLHAEVPAWTPLRDGSVTIAPPEPTPAERRWLWPLQLWRLRVPRLAWGPARALSAALYPRAVGPALARAGEGAAVVHVFGGDMPGLAAAQAARRLRVPLVVTPFAHPGAWGDDGVNLGLYRRAQAVLALLDAEADFYRARGVDPARVFTVGLWTELERPGRLPPGVPAEGPLVLFLGVKRPYKGYDTLAAAAPLVWREHPDATFVFAGPGEGDQDLDDPRVVQLGRLDEGAKAALLRRCTLLALPSRSEILPTVVLEAWTAGRPVVAADIPTVAELVGPGGVVVGPGEAPLARAISELLAAPERRERCAQAGADRLRRQFSRDAVMARIRDAYLAAGVEF